MTYFEIVKTMHVACAIATLISFSFRGILMMAGSSLLRAKPIKIIPHIIDTILLVSAILLAMEIYQYPFVHDWLTAKLIALVAYIITGTIALKRGKSKSTRIGFFFLSLMIFFYIVAVARTHNAWIFLS